MHNRRWEPRRLRFDGCIRWRFFVVRLPLKQRIRPDDQRQTQEVYTTQILIILANVGWLKRQVPIDRHVQGSHKPVTP